jgi:S-adenosylmethionine decarboxylase
MNDKFEVGFGPHLTLDLYGCNKKKLGDIAFIQMLLDNLPERIGMKKISEPNVIYYPGSEGTFDKGGCSGFVLIATSHITIHTFIEQEHAFVDIFSCKQFDTKFAMQEFIDYFEASRCDSNLFQRGLEFPRSIPVVQKFVKNERKISLRKQKAY